MPQPSGWGRAAYRLTSSVTTVSASASVPADGLCSNTISSGTSPLSISTIRHRRPESCSAARRLHVLRALARGRLYGRRAARHALLALAAAVPEQQQAEEQQHHH